MRMFSYSAEELTGACNDAISNYLVELQKCGIIEMDKYEELSKYRVVIHDKGFFSKLLDKWLGLDKKENSLAITVVKILNSFK